MTEELNLIDTLDTVFGREHVIVIDTRTSLGTKNLKGKTRPVSDPYEVYRNNQGWCWKILKHYQSPAAEAKNQYARVFCDVTSPYTMGGSDMGDTYLADIVNHAVRVK